MTARIRDLLARAQARTGRFWQRGVWAHESLSATAGRPPVLRQALSLAHILDSIPAVVAPRELIVGTHPRSEPPDPHPPSASLRVSQEPYRLPAERTALQAGVFTSGEKTGHLTVDYPRLLAEGLTGVRQRVDAALAAAEGDGSPELEAMAITLQATSAFSRRHAVRARETTASEPDPNRRDELTAIATACESVADGPPRNFHEATQLVWLAFLVQCIEEGESTAAFALGRLDQYLHPFWANDRAAGVPRDQLVELLACLWVKLNEFGGLQVLNLTIGGSDADWRDSVNDLSFACLELMAAMRTPVPSLSVRWHPGIDRAFLDQALRLATMGVGQPAFYGDPAARRAMEHVGVSEADAADVVPGGCVELGIQGSCYPWVGNFFNLAKCLELALHDGVDPGTGERAGPASGAAEDLAEFADLIAAYEQQVTYFRALMAHSDDTTDRLAAENNPYPFLSALVGDCIDEAQDITAGGARYNFTEVQGVGVSHVVDSLLNVRRLVHDSGEVSLRELVDALDADFSGNEPLRRRLRSLRPAYGDGDAEVAELARQVVEGFCDAIDGPINPRGGPHCPGLLVWTLYDEWADTVGALPDGRRCGETLASSIGPSPHVPVESPTSVIRDATSFDHWRCAGGLTLNVRLHASAARGREGLDAVRSLVEGYFERGGMQVQLNVVDSSILREARDDPGAHADLLVRVSGFVARFVGLSPRIQDEVIARTEHETG